MWRVGCSPFPNLLKTWPPLMESQPLPCPPAILLLIKALNILALYPPLLTGLRIRSFKNMDGRVCHLLSTRIGVGFAYPLPISFSIPSSYRDMACCGNLYSITSECQKVYLCIYRQHRFLGLLIETRPSMKWGPAVFSVKEFCADAKSWNRQNFGGRTMLVNCCMQLWCSTNSWYQLQ